MDEHIASVLERISDAMPDATALVIGEVRRSWREFDDRAARIASALLDRGLTKRSRVGLYLYNDPAYLEAYLAASKLGGVPANVNYRYLGEELVYVLGDAGAEAVFFHAALGERIVRVIDRLPQVKAWIEVADGVKSVGHERFVAFDDLVADYQPMERVPHDPDDFVLRYTGGTTGLPKGVMYRNGGQVNGYITVGCDFLGLPLPATLDELGAYAAERAAIGNQVVSLPACPLMHGTGIAFGATVPLLAGGCVVFLRGRSLDGVEVVETIVRESVTALTIVGDAVAKPINVALAARSEAVGQVPLPVTTVFSSGTMFSLEEKQELLRHLPDGAAVIDVFGSTEGLMGFSRMRRGEPVRTATFVPHETTKVITVEGGQARPGSDDVGVLASASPIRAEAYWNDPAKTADVFRSIDGIPHIVPGDWAKVNEDGTVTLLGRGSQCINTGGEKVFSEEVEEVIKRIDGVSDCVVTGVPDPRFGAVVAALVAVQPGRRVTHDDVAGGVRTELASYKIPRRVMFVAEIPRGNTGKIDYERVGELMSGLVDT